MGAAHARVRRRPAAAATPAAPPSFATLLAQLAPLLLLLVFVCVLLVLVCVLLVFVCVLLVLALK